MQNNAEYEISRRRKRLLEELMELECKEAPRMMWGMHTGEIGMHSHEEMACCSRAGCVPVEPAPKAAASRWVETLDGPIYTDGKPLIEDEQAAASTTENEDSILREAAGNLTMLLTIIRHKDTLSREAEADVRRVISQLKPDALKLSDIPKAVRSPLIVSRMIAKYGPTEERLELLRKHTTAYEEKYADEMAVNLMNGLTQMMKEPKAAASTSVDAPKSKTCEFDPPKYCQRCGGTGSVSLDIHSSVCGICEGTGKAPAEPARIMAHECQCNSEEAQTCADRHCGFHTWEPFCDIEPRCKDAGRCARCGLIGPSVDHV